MSDKNLLIGDTTYPHTPAFPKDLIGQLRFCAEEMASSSGHSICTIVMVKASLRIERLESELAEVQQDRVRYYWLQDWLESKVDSTEVFYQAKTRSAYNQAIDAAIKEGK